MRGGQTLLPSLNTDYRRQYRPKISIGGSARRYSQPRIPKTTSATEETRPTQGSSSPPTAETIPQMHPPSAAEMIAAFRYPVTSRAVSISPLPAQSTNWAACWTICEAASAKRTGSQSASMIA
jgi:hypothetical protein